MGKTNAVLVGVVGQSKSKEKDKDKPRAKSQHLTARQRSEAAIDADIARADLPGV